MKKYGAGLAAIALGVLMMPAAWSQDAAPAGPPPPPPPMHGHGPMEPEHQLRHLTKELNLNSEQQGQVKQILQARDAQMEQLHQNTALAPKDKHAQGKAIMTDSDAKLRAVLNPEQQQKFDAMRAEQMEHWQARRGGPGGEAPPPDGPAPPPPPQQ